MLGHVQTLRGYSLLLADPVVNDINELDHAGRAAFFRDMMLVGDALLDVTGARLINYQLLGNTEYALHAHIHPRYDDEPDDRRSGPPALYHDDPQIRFDPDRDKPLMDQIRDVIQRLAQ